MPMFNRGASVRCEPIDRWDDGVGWLAHPHEDAARASHAVADGDEVWLFDPLDAPGVDDLVGDLGDVAGVVVAADYHSRDAATFARRYDVPVYVPRWLDRPDDLIDAPVERFDGEVAGFSVREVRPLRAWRETVLYREHDGTLYVPDLLVANEEFTVGEERIAMNSFCRLFPPREAFAGLEPDRVLFGHDEGVTEDATAALRDSLSGARRRVPRALVSNGPTELRVMLRAVL